MAFGDVVQTNTGSASTSTVTPTLGSAITAGNLVVLTFAADDYNGSPPAGWTQSSEMEQQTFHGGYLWWFKATGGDTIPNYTIGSAVRSAWTVVEYAGPFDSSPYDTSQGNFVQSSNTTITSDAATPSTGSRLGVCGLQAQHASSDLNAFGTFTNSFTEAVKTNSNGANPRLALAQTKRVVTGDGSTTFSTAGTTPTQASQSRSANLIFFKEGATSGAMTGTSSLTFAAANATLLGAGAMSGTSSLTFSTTATMVGSGAMSGTSTMTFTPSTPELLGAGAMTGTSAIAFAVADANIIGDAPISGSSSLTFAVADAVVTGFTQITGSSSLSFSTSTPELLGSGAMSGTSTLDFSTSATLTGTAELSGTSTLSFGIEGNLTGLAPGAMSGTSSLSFSTSSASLLGAGAMSGTSSLTFTAAQAGTVDYPYGNMVATAMMQITLDLSLGKDYY